LPISHGALLIGDKEGQFPAIEPDSPAAKAGLMVDDIIISIDGEGLNQRDLATVLRSKRAGDTIRLVIWRDGKEQTMQVLLGEAE